MKTSLEDRDTFFHLVDKAVIWANDHYRLNQPPMTRKTLANLIYPHYEARVGHTQELHRIYKAVYRALQFNKSLREKPTIE